MRFPSAVFITVAIMFTSTMLPVWPAASTTSPTLKGSLIAIIIPEARLPSDSWNAKPRMNPVTPSPAISGATFTPRRPATMMSRTAQHAFVTTEHAKFTKSVCFALPRMSALRTTASTSFMTSHPTTRITAATSRLTAKSRPFSVTHAVTCAATSLPSSS